MPRQLKIVPLKPRGYFKQPDFSDNLREIQTDIGNRDQAYVQHVQSLNNRLLQVQGHLTEAQHKLVSSAQTIRNCSTKFDNDKKVREQMEDKLAHLTKDNSTYSTVLQRYQQYQQQQQQQQQQIQQQQQNNQLQQQQLQQRRSKKRKNTCQYGSSQQSYHKQPTSGTTNQSFLQQIYDNDDDDDEVDSDEYQHHVSKKSTFKKMY